MKNNYFLTIVIFLTITFSGFSMNNIYDIDVDNISGENLSLEKFKGNVILIVNTASRCGFTSQYSELENLFNKYKDKGFVVLGVPSRDFFQEYSSEEDVAEFCSTEYGVNFPMFATSKVRGNKASPLYKKLIAASGEEPSWNFNKYLISRDGQQIYKYGSKIKPDSPELTKQIEELL